MPFREHRLVIEQVHLRRAAHHEERDHRLGLGGPGRLLREEIEDLVTEERFDRGGEQAVLAEQRGEAEHAQAEAAGFEEVAS